MEPMQPTETDGAYLMEKIRSRCVEEGECLLWPGALSGGSSPGIQYQGKHFNLRRFLWLRMGKELPKNGKAIVTKCKDKRCLAEEHLAIGSRSRPGHKRTTAYRAKMASIGQERSNLTWDDVAEIRASTDSLDALCERYSKGQRTIQNIRSGSTWKVTTGPFAGLGERP